MPKLARFEATTRVAALSTPMARAFPDRNAQGSSRLLLFIAANMLIASCVSVTRSLPTRLSSSPRHLCLLTATAASPKPGQNKSFPCPLWSASFSFCLDRRPKSTTSSVAPPPSSMAVASDALDSNPLLQDFAFPPFDVVEPKHVRPGIRELLRKLEIDLEKLERTVEPTWPRLVEPLEKIVDRLQVVWGIVNHLKSVKDSPDLRSAIEEVQIDDFGYHF
ncbi:hypothetical protein GW17_00034617 [Ensete ventricosum]|nr:hypothetical protein GW17_00034617 [Ensete ventricosum]RZS23969.1 hypothetical protein BHM03_00056985 [Ensete ventricosum]